MYGKYFSVFGDCFMALKIIWKISRYRKDKRTGAISPIKPSKYYQSLSEGMGWNGRRTTGNMGGSSFRRI